MWPLTVVMVGVDAKDAFEVAAVADLQPVQTLGAYGPDEALGDRVRLRRPDRCLHDPHPSLRKITSKGPRVLAVAVADQEAHALGGEVESEIARLLGHPGADGIGSATGEPDAAASVDDEEQRVMAAQEHALNGGEASADSPDVHHLTSVADDKAAAANSVRSTNHPELGSGDLPPQDLELVAEYQQLDVFHVQAATATDQRAQMSPHGEERNEKAIPPILPTAVPLREETLILAPFRSPA
jgi:hypothetical protein